MLKTVMGLSCGIVLLAITFGFLSGNPGKNYVRGVKSGPYDQPKGKWNGRLRMDTALVNITSDLNEKKFSVEGVSSNCFKCDYQMLRENVQKSTYIIVDTHFEFQLRINAANGQVCIINHTFAEYWKYYIHIRIIKSKDINCIIDRSVKPTDSNTYQPILIAFGVLAASAFLWALLTQICRRYHLGTRLGIFSDNESLINADLGSPNRLKHSGEGDSEQKPDKPIKSKRLHSLDTFRGIALTVMIFVNYGGGGYYFFHHSRWNGLTVADLVFPWFMWIMGVSMSLSFRAVRRRQVKKHIVFFKIFKRTTILFGLGVFVSNMGDLANYRVPGVLQRFAACYFVVATVQFLAPPSDDSQPTGRWDPIRDVVTLWPQWLFMTIILAIYILVTYAIKIENCPIGYTGPGGIGQGFPEAFNCTGGVSHAIDKWIFGDHVYHQGTFKDLYRVTVYHDPEGALGTLTSIVLVFLGVQAGVILLTYSTHKARLARWFAWSLVLGCIAIGLSAGTKNDGIIPINKNLWSVSFILATGAMAFIVMSLCYLLVDVYGVWNGAPFIYPGMNSIVVYCGSEVLATHFPFSWKLAPYYTHGVELFMDMVGTGCWIVVAYYMYWIEFFVKI